jgi:hypothetical protein
LNLQDGQRFTWKFTAPKQKPSELTGQFSVEQNVLNLRQSDGGSLVGQVTLHGSDGFNFKLLGGPQEDPGLDFSKR